MAKNGAGPAPEGAAKKERSDAMRLPPEEAADLDARDVSRPYQRKICRACGKAFRTCSGGRLDCTTCSPPTLGRRMDPVVKDALREPKGSRQEGGDVRDPLAPPDAVRAALDFLSNEENLKPKTTTEATALLGKVAAYVAAGHLSSLRGRALTGIITAQIRVLTVQETRAHREQAMKDREQRRSISLAKRDADKKARADKKEAERIARAQEKERNGGKPVVEVPLPQPSAQDLRIAEGA